MNYTTNDMTAESSVARGVQWLDANVPGWEQRIVVEQFDIGSGCRCVCGFVFNEAAAEKRTANRNSLCYDGFDYACQTYDRGDEAPRFVDEDGKTHYWTEWHGFDGGCVDWDELQDEWLRVLAERGYE